MPGPARSASRFAIRRDAVWRPLLALFGATGGRSFVALQDDVVGLRFGWTLHLRFGWLFDERVPLDEVVEAVPAPWPLLGGIGWRTDFAGKVALVGSRRGVVRLRLRERRRVRLGLKVPCDVLYVSLEQPMAFLEELARDRGPDRETDRGPGGG